MSNLHLLTGIRLQVLFKLIRRNGIRIRRKNLLRFIVLLQNAFISSVLSVVEKRKYNKVISSLKISQPPTFIIGHWRTGTTFLHQMMSLDDQFTAPTVLQVSIPDHFLFSTRYYIPVMNRILPKTRPMDNVPVSPFEPQEDEFALIRMGTVSPLEGLFFYTGKGYFLSDINKYLPEGSELRTLKKNLLTFYKKITYATGKRIVSKNPYHTLRTSLLSEIFPEATFIHVKRNPCSVVPSTIHMWNVIAATDNLGKPWHSPDIPEVTSNINLLSLHAESCKKETPENRFTEVVFENLEKNPLEELKRIYHEIDLDFTEDFENKLNDFLRSAKDYTKNKFQLSKKDKETIERHMQT